MGLMRYLISVVATLIVVWAVVLGSLNLMEDLGKNVGYGVERMVLGGDDEQDIADLEQWLTAREERLEKAGDHLGWARLAVWVAPPGMRSEVSQIITDAQQLRVQALELIGEVERLNAEYDAFAPLIGEPVFVEGKGFPAREQLMRREALDLLKEIEQMIRMARAWQQLKQDMEAIGERGAELQERAVAEREYWVPFRGD
ncbi:hypothetical protein LRD18_04245 [Halorhodospira halochloris]|uniref:hypothetical protein n=1 Tax=Halorhodospira halochloris TaxID=1052 RepID=UPI001EE7AD83|nr:hypothetical protein [Halorhodospira halochloris]MCG5530082.1 hypothetical protein [Halorhodospira halochloris]